MTALTVCDIKKAYRSGGRTVTACDGVSFEVNGGEIFGLLGMNGAGKSTTIGICTGLIKPDGGTVSVFGHDILTDTRAAKSLLNVSPQETAVASMLSVRENLTFIASVYGAGKQEAKERAEAMAARLGLSDRMNDRAGKLSGGLKRRLSLGMALITEPKLVFLDEPTLGLDVVARRGLWQLIRDVAGETAIVLTTHYLEEAEVLCGRIAVMTSGKIAAVGSAAELKEQSGKDKFEDAFLTLSEVEAGV